jgi:vacuolar protein sorting-associated protein 29
VIEVEGVRIGLVHGHLVMPRGDEVALNAVRRWLQVDVLISAATGRSSTRQVGSGLLVDPGSVTGMRCSELSTGMPSFSLLSLDAGKVWERNSVCVHVTSI